MRKITPREVSSNLEKMSSSYTSMPIRKSFSDEGQMIDVYQLKLDYILPYKKQARKSFNDKDIEELAETIRAHGVLQPISVIKSEDVGYFEVISGERRLRASKLVGLEKIPAIILEESESIEEIALVENIQRADLHPVEFADSLASLMSNAKYGDLSKLSSRIGVSLSKISEYLPVSKLPESVKHKMMEFSSVPRKMLRDLLKLSSEKEMLDFLAPNNGGGKSKNFNIKRPFHVKKISGRYRLILNERPLTIDEKRGLIEDLKSIIMELKK